MSPRPVKEWLGRTPTSMPSVKVFDRLYDAQQGICACGCGMWMDRNVDKIVRDHKKALKDGGENREGNLQLMLEKHHQAKTSEENSGRAEAEGWHAKAYVRPRQKMQGRTFPQAEPQRSATRPIQWRT